ncbi:MAG: transcriptional regulator (iclr family) protein [Ramlibacter sp.]|nr:transcriptional regulator (iclr family) protein [Ramlibacter sp.]
MHTHEPSSHTRTNEVKSAARILDLLELLSLVSDPIRLTDIALRLDLPKSSAFALLNTLAGRGYVDANGDGYVLSPRYRQGAWVGGEVGLIRRAAEPVMGALSAETGESCFLAVAAPDWQIQYIDKAVTENPLRYDISLPMLRPAHSTSVGLVLLADLSDDVLRRYLASSRIQKVTAKTVTDPELLLHTIQRVRDSGFAMISDSSVIGASGVSAAIHDTSGAAVAALCVIAPTARFDAARHRIVVRVQDAAKQIGAQLPKDPPAAAGASASRRQTQWIA